MAYKVNGIRMAPFETFKEYDERVNSDEPYNEDFINRCRAKALEYDNEPIFGVSCLYEIKLAIPMHYRDKVLEGTKSTLGFEQHLKDIGLRY